MMFQLKIHHNNSISEHIVPQATTLLTAIHSLGFDIYSPCGGNGTCGKCKLYVKGEGWVTSCLFVIDKDLEVVLPNPSEAAILVSQYEHSIDLPAEPGPIADLSSYPMGIAIDVGTTTVVMHLINLITGSLVESKAVVNPQVRYGADVISRINYCIHHDNGIRNMQQGLMGAINEKIEEFTLALGISNEEIVKFSITGNAIMQHIFLGVDPSSMAYIPFKAVFLDKKVVPVPELGLKSNPKAEAHVLPSIAAYVGADIVAGIASLKPKEDIGTYLYIDIGTNGEMACVTKDKMYCCATAAGPAFEGANITCGMAAVEGAISVYNDTGYKTIGNAVPQGICGSGLIDIAAELIKSNIIDSEGNMEKDFVVVDEEKSGANGPIIFTQKDVRELQLAKSAIATGIKILLKHAGISYKGVDALFLAGGFGNYINKKSSITIGLLPPELEDKIIPVGNASGTGASLHAKSIRFEQILNEVIQKAHYIELSEDEDFPVNFAMNMGFAKQEQ